MTYDIAALLSEHFEVELDDLAHATGLSVAEIVDLVEYGVFEPAGAVPVEWRFSARCITLGRRASRLRSDFELDTPGLALVAALLERIDELEAEAARLRAQLLG
ncbi:MAG TPA: chaperone modulator CbpM [Burkholderiales bacterium]|nr:chaperone modulator CbpM [Burkholderiales bacterium]